MSTLTKEQIKKKITTCQYSIARFSAKIRILKEEVKQKKEAIKLYKDYVKETKEEVKKLKKRLN